MEARYPDTRPPAALYEPGGSSGGGAFNNPASNAALVSFDLSVPSASRDVSILSDSRRRSPVSLRLPITSLLPTPGRFLQMLSDIGGTLRRLTRVFRRAPTSPISRHQ